MSLPVLFIVVPAAALCSTRVMAQSLGGWLEPDGGWNYVYHASDGEDIDGEFDPVFFGASFDGTWNHNNGSDAWDGSGPGDQFRPDGVTPAAPGGAGIEILPGLGEDGGDAHVLSVVDTGDPRTRGFADPSNRKVWFCHDVAQDGVDGSFSLRNGITFIVRSRLHPDVDPEAAGWQLPDGGLDSDAGQGAAPGYALRDGGKGGHGFYDTAVDRNFSFTPFGTTGYQLPPVVGEGLPPANFLEVGDNTVFHSFWIQVSDEEANDRYDVTVYLNGSTTPSQFFDEILLGDDTDCDGMSHLHLGFHSTPQVGGFQIDYFGYKLGIHEPQSVCPGDFAAAFDPETGAVALRWSPPAQGTDSFTVRRDGSAWREGLPADQGTLDDPDPPRPQAVYELVAMVGGSPNPLCTVQQVTVRTVVCPVLSAVPDRAAGKVNLSWTAPRYFNVTSYSLLRNGAVLEELPGSASAHVDSPPPGEHDYQLAILSVPHDACPVNPSASVRLFGPGAVEVSGDGWDRVVVSGLAELVTTVDGVKSLHFPGVPKGAGDSAFFAVEVLDLGTEEVLGGRYRVELVARYENEVRITNRSFDPPSHVHFNLSRTGVSYASDDAGNTEAVEQVPAPSADPTTPSASSTIVNTETVGLLLQPGLNIMEVHAVDAVGAPHGDQIQLFAVRIGAFAQGLAASLATFPCPSALSGTKAEGGAITLTWTPNGDHAYQVERNGVVLADLPSGLHSSYEDPAPGPGFFTYQLRVTDSVSCPVLSWTGGGGAPDPEGFIREWLILGPLDWRCIQSCDDPGLPAIRGDYLRGTDAEGPVDEASIEPRGGQEITLGAQALVRDAPRTELNPGRPGRARWFAYQSITGLVDHNIVFGGDPGNNYMVYAVVYLENTAGAPITADLGVTSDDSVQVLLNDQEIHINNIARGVGLPGSAAFDVVPGITIPEGTSRLMVKVFEGGGGTGFALRFEEPGTGIPMINDLEVSLVPPEVIPPGPRFRRGNVNGDALLDISDAIGILGFLFLGQADKVVCVDAADIKDKGSIDISDAISVLNFLFQGGPAPAAPGPEVCGTDVNQEAPDLGCQQGCT